MVPTWTGKWESIFQSGKSQGILNRLQKSGDFTKNTGKERAFYPKYWRSEGILASFYFHFFTDFLIEVYLLNRFFYLLNSLNEMPRKYWKWRKILEKPGKFVSPKMWKPWKPPR